MDWREIAGIAEEVPLFTVGLQRPLVPITSVPLKSFDRSDRPQGKPLVDQHDGIERPAFQHLSVTLLSGNRIVERKREAMPDVEVGARIQLLVEIVAGGDMLGLMRGL